MKLTIKNIAQLAGVSPGTVSKVINGTGNISHETTEKIMKIIKETGYRPSFSAKTLTTKKSNLIGLIYAGSVNAEHNHPFFNPIINTFKNTIGQLGYDILIFSNTQHSKDHIDYLARCKYFQLDGCLIIAGDHIEQSIFDLDESDIPCVAIDIELKGPRSSYVTTDNKKVSSLVVDYLRTHSIKDVAFIGGPEDSIVSNIRKEALIQSMNLLGISIKPVWIQHGNYFEDGGYAAMKNILSSSSFPKAVFAASDMMALGALKAIKEAGLSVPADIMLIGCDDIELCRYSDPPVASVKQDKEKMGKCAANILFELINGESNLSPVKVDPELIIRESCQI